MRMCRRLGISSESSTEVGRKRGKKMRGLAGEQAGGVGMCYEVGAGGGSGYRLLTMVR
jgi:hypothetical protein